MDARKDVFSPISYFRKLEDRNIRGDRRENTTLITKNLLRCGRFSLEIGGHTLGDGFIEASISHSEHDNIHISCFSHELSDELRKEFGQYVISFDTDDFESYIKNDPIFSNMVFCESVRYCELDELHDIPPNPFKKYKEYGWQKEFRIIIKSNHSEFVKIISQETHLPIEIRDEITKDSKLKYFFNVV